MRLKTFVKLLVCAIGYHCGFFHIFLRTIFLGKKEFPSVIINYHSFVTTLDQCLDPHPTVTHLIEDFENEIIVLKKYFDFKSLDEIVDAVETKRYFKKPTLTITVDDGYLDNYELLFPVIQRHNIPVTIFVNTGFIGTNDRPWFKHVEAVISQTRTVTLTHQEKREFYLKNVQRLKNIPTIDRDIEIQKLEDEYGVPQYQERLMMNWNEIREMDRSRVVTFGAHTAYHPILTQLPLDEAKQEILDSKITLEKELSKKVKHFAYPNGRPQDFNEELRRYCQDIGFSSICTCDYGVNDHSVSPYTLKRTSSEIPVSLLMFNLIRAFYV